ncbi:hypothetical protein MTO96_031428 [Rhipicephalus appendiculatus]
MPQITPLQQRSLECQSGVLIYIVPPCTILKTGGIMDLKRVSGHGITPLHIVLKVERKSLGCTMTLNDGGNDLHKTRAFFFSFSRDKAIVTVDIPDVDKLVLSN